MLPFEVIDPANPPKGWKEDFAISKEDYDHWSVQLSSRLPPWVDDRKRAALRLLRPLSLDDRTAFHQISPWSNESPMPVDPKDKVVILHEFSGHCSIWPLNGTMSLATELDCYPLQRIIREELAIPQQSAVDIDL